MAKEVVDPELGGRVRMKVAVLFTVIAFLTAIQNHWSSLFAVELPTWNLQNSADAKAEDWVYLENDFLKVGFLKSHGGALAYLSTAKTDTNVLNHFDHGRLVQQSYYGDSDDSRWGEKPWRFNPVQGGDYRGRAAKLVEFKATETTAYARTLPRHWASGKLVEDCVMEQWAELDGPIVRMRYRFVYQGKKSHRARHQETPAVFVEPELKTLVTYEGSEPWTGGPLTRRSPGWPNEYVKLGEPWAAWVDDGGVGVGICVPGTEEATTYRFQGGRGSSCSYIAPLRTFALTPDLTFSYEAYLTLGSVEQIRSRFSELPRQSAKRVKE